MAAKEKKSKQNAESENSGAKRGPKPLYTPETLREAVDLYMDKLINEGVFPDEAGMRISLGVSKRTWERYAADEEYRDVLDYAKDKRQSYLERLSVSAPKLAQGCMNLLKQQANGGLVDRQQENSEKKLTVVFTKNISNDDFA